MLSFNAWHQAHFQDASRRQWFADQILAMQGQQAGMMAQGYPAPQDHAQRQASHAPDLAHASSSAVTLEALEAADADPFEPYPGETDEEWQARHGFSHLTPGAVKIFDASRKFREERDLEDAAQAAADAAAERRALEEEAEVEDDEDEILNALPPPKRAPEQHQQRQASGSVPVHLISQPGQGTGTRAKKRQRRQAAIEKAYSDMQPTASLPPRPAPSHAQQAAERAAAGDFGIRPTAPPAVPDELAALRARALSAKRAKG